MMAGFLDAVRDKIRPRSGQLSKKSTIHEIRKKDSTNAMDL